MVANYVHIRLRKLYDAFLLQLLDGLYNFEKS